jgi:hypothetical protein
MTRISKIIQDLPVFSKRHLRWLWLKFRFYILYTHKDPCSNLSITSYCLTRNLGRNDLQKPLSHQEVMACRQIKQALPASWQKNSIAYPANRVGNFKVIMPRGSRSVRPTIRPAPLNFRKEVLATRTRKGLDVLLFLCWIFRVIYVEPERMDKQ